MNNFKKTVTCKIPTELGDFQLALYENESGEEHMAYSCGEIEKQKNVLVRVHSECFTGEVLGSLRCDCKEQLGQSLSMIAESGGLLIYLKQEGRGIGLKEKLKAYNLQDTGLDTVDANLELGHEADHRDFNPAIDIIKDFQIQSIRLITNNPEKFEKLSQHFQVNEQLRLTPSINPHNWQYLRTKLEKLHHQLDLPDKLPKA